MMRWLVIFLKVMLVTFLASVLMYFLLSIDGTIREGFSDFFEEFFPMLCIVIFLAIWHKNSMK